MVEITDSESLEAWFEALKGDEEARRKVAVQIAQRAAMRVLPKVWDFFELSEYGDAVRDQGCSTLPLLRLCLALGVASNARQFEPSGFVNEAIVDAEINPVYGYARAIVDASKVVDCEMADLASQLSVVCQETFDELSSYFSDDEYLEAWQADFHAALSGDVLSRPLWLELPAPIEIIWGMLSNELRLSDDHAHWEFWVHWYELSLRGEPQDWEGLLTDVALIEDDIWEQGVAAVGERISVLQDKYDLLAQIRELKAERAQMQATLAHRSHNMPPELVDAPPKMRSSLAQIWSEVDAAEAELEADTPDPSRLASIGRALLNACTQVLAYCGAKADVAITKAFEELGASGAKWAIQGGTLYWVGQTQTAQTIAGRLIELAQRLP